MTDMRRLETVGENHYDSATLCSAFGMMVSGLESPFVSFSDENLVAAATYPFSRGGFFFECRQ